VRCRAFEDLVGKLRVASIKDLFGYTDGDTGDQGKGDKYRAIVLEGVKGETVTIGIGASPTDFAEFLAKSQKVLDTVKWTGS
jgi:hypothetical protein